MWPPKNGIIIHEAHETNLILSLFLLRHSTQSNT